MLYYPQKFKPFDAIRTSNIPLPDAADGFWATNHGRTRATSQQQLISHTTVPIHIICHFAVSHSSVQDYKLSSDAAAGERTAAAKVKNEVWTTKPNGAVKSKDMSLEQQI